MRCFSSCTKVTLQNRTAFTLIEITIVLVIIGLIVGGILVGQNLIAAGTARAQIKQVADLETQIGLFRNKFNCLPGDCANATSFLGTTYNGYTIANGDGDGTIRSGELFYSSAPDCQNGTFAGTEVTQLFLHLNAAGLGNYPSDLGFTAGNSFPYLAGVNRGLFVTCLQGALSPLYNNLRFSNVIVLATAAQMSSERIEIAVGLSWNSSSAEAGDYGQPISTFQAIDQKMDDGFPLTGNFGLIGAAPGCATGSNVYPSQSASYCPATGGKSLGPPE